jgi:CRISPR-associated protein Cas2
MRTYLVTYDISSPERWRRVHEALLDFGRPLQFGVFVCHLRGRDAVRLRARLRQLVNQEEDRALICPLCDQCLEQVELLGRQASPQREQGPVIV